METMEKLEDTSVTSDDVKVWTEDLMGDGETDNTSSKNVLGDSETEDMSGNVLGDGETENMSGNAEEEEDVVSDTEFEYEFFPSVPTMRRDKSASPDPAEAVLDQLYEAAQKGDSSQLVNLMFSEMKPTTTIKDKSKVVNGKVKGQNTDVNQNYAIMNMLKRKTTCEKDKTEVNKRSKLSIDDSLEDTDIPNFEQFEHLTSLDTVCDKDYSYFQNPVRKKNCHRTPTPPPCSPPKNMKLKRTINQEQFKPMDVKLTHPTFRRPRLHPVPIMPKSLNASASKSTKYMSLLSGSMTSTPDNDTLPDDSADDPDNDIESDNVPNTVYDEGEAESQSDKVQTPPTVEQNLIDYTVLTKALSKTLESKLQEDDNDVKIVIFCNNKPIQSFSVRSNKQQAAANETSESSSPLKSPSETEENQNGIKELPTSVSTSSTLVTPTNISRINKANAHLVQPNTVPTIGDVKAILERNKRIAYESLARFSCGRMRTKQIQKEFLAKLAMNFETETILNNENREGSSEPVNPDPALSANLSGPSLVTSTLNSAFTASPTGSGQTQGMIASITGQKIAPLNWNPADDDTEGALVINEAVTNDENNSVNVKQNQPSVNNDIIGICCDQCGKSFKHRRYLYRHRVRIHSMGKFNKPSAASKTNKASHKEPDGTLIANIPDNLDAISNELENENPELVIKTEPGTEFDDTSAEPGLETDNADDVDNVLNMLESADKGKRSLYINDGLNGIKADALLNGSPDQAKPYPFDYRTPVGANGLIEPVYVCEQCGKFYRARKTLKDHFFREHAKHKDDEPLYLYISGNKYQCPICFKNFHSGTDLVIHTKKHTGELRSVCPLCSKVYSSVHVLRRHMETVHTDLKPRPFQCELCNYAASNKWHLKEHYRRHTGEQPYKCPICVKSFSHQGTMNRHCKTIHRLEVPSQRPYPRNNICDLPDLPLSSSDMDSSIPDMESSIPDMESGIPNMESGIPDDGQLMSSEMEFEEMSPGTSNDINVDLSIVKTEPMEAPSE